MNNAAINVHVQVLYGHMFSFLVGICLGIELLGHVVTLCLTFEEQLNIFPKWSHFTFPPASMSVPIFPTPSLTLAIVCLFYYSHLSGCEVVSWCAFSWWLMMLSIFLCAYSHLYIFFGEMSFQIIYALKIALSFYCGVVRVLSPLSEYMICKHVLPCVGCPNSNLHSGNTWIIHRLTLSTNIIQTLCFSPWFIPIWKNLCSQCPLKRVHRGRKKQQYSV